MRVNIVLSCLLISGMPLVAAIPFDCGRGISLQTAINFAYPGETLELSGVCAGPLVITGKSITLVSKSKAVIEGNGKDVVTVNGPALVRLKGLVIQHGNTGINAGAGAQLAIENTAIQANALNGVFLQGASSATISGSSTDANGNNGLDAEASSAVIMSGTFQSQGNGVFGVNINGGSSLTFSQAQVTVSKNILGVQIGTGAAAFISDPVTVLTVKDNFTTGLTIVSGSHMVAFGGTIQTTGNGIHGVSVDSKAGLDLDAAAVLTSSGNTQDGVHLEETSVLTMFNTPAFSGAPGVTTINTQNNGGNGLSLLTGSNFTVIHQAALNSTGNANGVFADNGSSVTLIQSNITSNGKDVVLSFGSRADITTSTIGSLSCDASVLIRGDTGRTCPK